MKQKVVLAVTLLSILFTGCESKSESTLVQDGKKALEQHQYNEAMKILSSALEEDNTDDHARAMYMQAMKMVNVLEYESQANYKRAIEELEVIENIKGGSSTIKSEASSKKKELEKLNEDQKNAEQERKENAKAAAVKDKYRLEKKALEASKKAEEKKKKEEEEKKKEEEEKKKEEETDKEQNPLSQTPESTEQNPISQTTESQT